MMNERIKEIAEQANIKFGRMAILDGDPRGMARYVTYSEFEKFAELLIRECMNICKAHPSRTVSNNWNADAVAPDIVNRISEHFEVDE
jgi:hypothetical protein